MALPPLPLTCEVKFPSDNDSLHDHVDRWSDIHVVLPAVVVVPETEADIISAVQYAQANGLRVIVAGGGHAPFVPVTAKTLYLDLRLFKSIAVDEAASTVTIGGGVLTGELLSALLEKGLYTTLPNSSALGVVGAVLGVGNGSLNSLHSLMADNVEGAQIVTASADGVATRNISPSSTGDERCLFDALCGAGHGLGVVVSLTLKAHRIVDLHLDSGDQIWQRRAIFPGPAIRDAARTFVSLLPLQGPAAATLLFARAPPGTPNAGAPIAMLIGSHFGPGAEAEASAAGKILLSPEVSSKAVMAVTEGVPFAKINASTEPFNTHGGTKLLDGTFLHGISEDTIVTLFEKFVAFGNGRPDLVLSYLAIAAWDNTKALELGATPERKDNYFVTRDCSVLALNAVWSNASGPAVEAESKAYIASMKEVAKEGETQPVISFANNLAFPASITDYFPQRKAEKLQGIKAHWDPNGLFWSPYMGAE